MRPRSFVRAVGAIAAMISSCAGATRVTEAAKTKKDETAIKLTLPRRTRGVWGRALPRPAPTGNARYAGQIKQLGIGRRARRIPR